MGFTKAGNRKSNLHLLPLKGNLHTEKIPVRVVPAALSSSLRAPAARPDSTPLIDSSSPIIHGLCPRSDYLILVHSSLLPIQLKPTYPVILRVSLLINFTLQL